MEEKYIFNEHEATVIKPDNAAEGRPWVWRAEFLGDFDYIDKDLLSRGWHIVYYKVSDMFGCPEAIDLMKKFRDDVVRRFNLNEKADIFGFSRGGLYASNYTLAYPNEISTLYLDAPVLDVLSWPGGFGKGRGSDVNWQMCKKWYNISDGEEKYFRASPLYHLQELIDTGVPVLLIAGDADTTVPYEENGAQLDKLYRMQGARIMTIVKPGVEHHPHSVEDTAEPVNYIIENRKYSKNA